MNARDEQQEIDAELARRLTDAVRTRWATDGGPVAGLLTSPQHEAVAHFRSLGVTANWFVGEPSPEGQIEVLALGEDWIWSFIVEPDGEVSSQEAEVGEFSTGISC